MAPLFAKQTNRSLRGLGAVVVSSRIDGFSRDDQLSRRAPGIASRVERRDLQPELA